MNALVILGLGSILARAPGDTMVVPLPEVVVTGTRIPESALRVPAAVTVVDRRSYADTRGISLQDALGLVPGVFVQSRAGAQDVRVTIRGYGARGNGERSNAGSMRGIRIMTDGISVTEPDGRTSLDLADLGISDRVEIARSNSSVLYGNASGGVIQLRTNLLFARPYAELRERAGSFGFHREQGLFGFTAGRARGVFSLLNSTFEGWRDHSSSVGTQASMRLAVPLDDRTRLGLIMDAVNNLNRFPGALTRAQLDSFPKQANPIFVSRDERRRNRVGRVAMTLDRSLGGGQQLATSAFVEPKVLQRSERGRFRDFNRYHLGGSASYELRRRISPDLESVTLAGADEAFQDGSILFYGLLPDGSRGSDLRANKREAANGAGAFVQEELRWRERWSLRVAGRYDNLWYVAEDHVTPALDAEKTFAHWTPKGSLSYGMGDHTLYAALGGGVEAPAFNEIDPPPPLDTLTSFNPFLEAMRSTTYELGARGRLGHAAGGPLTYDAAMYRIDVANDIVPFDGGAYFFTAGQSRREGFEAGLEWQPIEPLWLSGTVALSRNEYRTYRNDLGDFSGRRVAGLPDRVIGAAARYVSRWGLGLRLSLEEVGRYFADDANTAVVPEHAIGGATLSYERETSRSRVRFFVGADNVTGKRYVASAFINGVRGEYFEPGLPRSWSSGLTVRWR